jgi:hypothetical protein
VANFMIQFGANPGNVPSVQQGIIRGYRQILLLQQQIGQAQLNMGRGGGGGSGSSGGRSVNPAQAWTQQEILARVTNQRILNDNRRRLDAELQNQGVYMRGVQVLMTQQEIAARVHNQRITNLNQDAIEKAMHAAGVQYKGMRNGWEGARMFAGGLAQVVGLFGAIAGGVGIFNRLGDAVAEAGRKQRENAEEFIRQRDAMREIESMRGGTANAESALAAARFQVATGYRAGEAGEFTKGFLGAGAQFEGQTIGRQDFKDFQLRAAQLGAVKGFDPRVMGELAGSTLGFSDYGARSRATGVAAEDIALGDMNQALSILEHGKGDNATMARQLQMLSAAAVNEDDLKGVFRNQADAAVALSTMAEFNPEEAFVYTQATNKFLRGKDKETEGLFARAGFTPKMGFEERIEKLAPILMAQSKAQAKPLQDVIAEYTKDVREQRGLATAILQGSAQGRGLFDERRKFGAGVAGPQPALDQIRRARLDPEGALGARIAEAQLDLAKLERGRAAAGFVSFHKLAEAQLQQERAIDTSGTNLTDAIVDTVDLGVPLGVSAKHREQRIRARMAEMAIKTGRRAGVEYDYRGLENVSGAGDESAAQEMYDDLFRKIRAAGFNPMTGERLNDPNAGLPPAIPDLPGPQAMNDAGLGGGLGLRGMIGMSLAAGLGGAASRTGEALERSGVMSHEGLLRQAVALLGQLVELTGARDRLAPGAPRRVPPNPTPAPMPPAMAGGRMIR